MIDYAQSFDEFSRSLKPMDLALYGGAAIVLYVIFKEKLGPVQNLVKSLFDKVGGLLSSSKNSAPSPVVSTSKDTQDVFFQLIASWKKTRDLAVKSNCVEAIKVADQMFPYLSPTTCKDTDNE